MIDEPCLRLTYLKTPFVTVGPWLKGAVLSAFGLSEPRTCFGCRPSVQLAIRNGAYTPFVTNSTVWESTARTDLRCCSRSPRYAEVNSLYLGENIRLYVKTTSSAVSGVPSDHFPFGRSLKTYFVPPFETVGSADATAGIGCPFAFTLSRPSKQRPEMMYAAKSCPTRGLNVVGSARLASTTVAAGERLGERESRAQPGREHEAADRELAGPLE